MNCIPKRSRRLFQTTVVSNLLRSAEGSRRWETFHPASANRHLLQPASTLLQNPRPCGTSLVTSCRAFSSKKASGSWVPMGKSPALPTRSISGGPTEEVSFSALADGTKYLPTPERDFCKAADDTPGREDFELMCRVWAEATTGEKLAKRSLDMLLGMKGEEYKLTAKVDMYEHSVQTATRALRDGADEEMVVCCLLHDIGEMMSPSNHGEVASGLLRPYISPANAWTLENHEVFQGFYYYHHLGGDKNAREIFKDHEFYQRTIDFCHKYDQPSFDPEYKSESLDVFVPMVERIFARRPFFWDLTHPKACAVVNGGCN